MLLPTNGDLVGVIWSTHLETFLNAMAVSVVVTVCLAPSLAVVLAAPEVMTPACLNHLSD